MKLFSLHTDSSRRGEAGLSLLEVTLASTLFMGAMLVATKFQGALQQNMTESNQRLERQGTSSDIMDRLDSLLRSSSANLAPFRILDENSTVLRDKRDNDGDGEIDELDEAFPVSPALANGQTAQAIWFQRIAGIDDMTVPPTIKYDPPSYARFVPDREDPRDGRDNDGDGIVDEGRLVVRVSGGELAIASNVTEFTIKRNEQALEVVIALTRPSEGGRTPEVLRIHREIYVRNW